MKITRGRAFIPYQNYPSYTLKAIIEYLVSAIPELSISSVTTDTSSTYEATLAYNGILFTINNVSSNYVNIKFGSKVYKNSYNTIVLGGNNIVAYAYTDSGALSFQFGRQNSSYAAGVELAPIDLTLSDGSVKTLYSVRGYVLSSSPENVVLSMAQLYFPCTDIMIDPDDQSQYSIKISGENTGAVSESKGDAVAVPLVLSTSYGNVASYAVKGASPYYVIYPGSTSYLQFKQCGLYTVRIGDSEYLPAYNHYFIKI